MSSAAPAVKPRLNSWPPLWLASIRFRVTLWNVAVMALMLFSLGVALRYSLQTLLIVSLDRGLGRRGSGVQRWVDTNVRLTPNGQAVIFTSQNAPPMPPPPATGTDGRLFPQSLNPNMQPLFADHPDVAYDRGAAFARALAGTPTYSTTTFHKEPIRVLSVPMRVQGQIIGVSQMGRTLTDTYQEVRRLTVILLYFAAPALLIAGLGGAFLTTRALRPIRRITQDAGRIEAGNLSGRLAVAGRDELSEMATTFNGMLDHLEAAFQERAAAYAEIEQAYQRLEQVNTRLAQVNEQQRRFIADASHELRTPLTVIEGTVSLSLSEPRAAEHYRKSLQTVGTAAGMMTKIVQDLLLLARSDSGQMTLDRRAVSVRQLLSAASETMSGRDHAPVILTLPDPDLSVCGDPDYLIRLFLNLFNNAAQHTPADGQITVSAERDGDFVTISVRDTGTGIAPEHLPHVFERFYRVDAARARRHGGTGLGLAICRSIVEAHGGEISLDSVLGEGSCVRVRLPGM